MTRDKIAELEKTNPMYCRIRHHVEMMIPQMKTVCTLKKICGKKFWGKLSKGQQIAAGSYITLLVKFDELSLTGEGKDSSNSKLYRRK